jgi:small subunit ribosomal protein S20
MANTSSAKKAIRVSERRYKFNQKVRRQFKDARRDVKKAVEKKDQKKALELLPKAYKEIDKAAKMNVIHKNAAGRYKSRLATKVNSL